jgi:DNA invertase Pin-like site-specific DNA recombinase
LPLVVWKLDRFTQSIRHLIETVTELDSSKVSAQNMGDAAADELAMGLRIVNIMRPGGNQD